MEERTGIFAGDDPIELTRMWMSEAEAAEPNDPNAAQLATVDATGLPNVRTVLIKEVEADGFVFYTNFTSAKGAELDASGLAAFVMHWKSLRRQVRVRGAIERVGSAQADAYFASRPLGSRLGAWASDQSAPISGRHVLVEAAAAAEARFGENPPRPEHWGGYRLRPTSIEFWADGESRLHDRFLWSRKNGGGWDIARLAP